MYIFNGLLRPVSDNLPAHSFQPVAPGLQYLLPLPRPVSGSLPLWVDSPLVPEGACYPCFGSLQVAVRSLLTMNKSLVAILVPGGREAFHDGADRLPAPVRGRCFYPA